MRNRQPLRLRLLSASLVFCALFGCGIGSALGQGKAAVYSLTNDPDANSLVVFPRNTKGQLAEPVFYPTGGVGSGGSLHNQGALALGSQKNFIYAVNAGSNTISVFYLATKGPVLIQVLESGGFRPVSLAVHNDLLYVLNDGGDEGGFDTIDGFDIHSNGRLLPIHQSQRSLSQASTSAAQISFSPSGTELIVTERSTNLIDVFGLNARGLAVSHSSTPSSGPTPFGFGFATGGALIVSEAHGGAAGAGTVSSYLLQGGGLQAISAAVPTTQTSACWIAVTANGKWAYTTNTSSDTITGYAVHSNGALSRLNQNGVTALTGSLPSDLTILGDNILFQLNRGDGTIDVYHIGADGSLTPLQETDPFSGTNPSGLVGR